MKKYPSILGGFRALEWAWQNVFFWETIEIYFGRIKIFVDEKSASAIIFDYGNS